MSASPAIEPPPQWPAVLTPPLLMQYLGVKSSSTLMRRVHALKRYGLPEKDSELNGWLRTEIDDALAKKRGIISSSAWLMGELEKWEPF